MQFNTDPDFHTRQVTEIVAFSHWFDATAYEPGQPGVYEVNPLDVTDDLPSVRRFSYFDGKDWHALCSAASMAFECRFLNRHHSILAFRGLEAEV